MYKCFTLLICVLLLATSNVFATSTNEAIYNQLQKQNSMFRQADKELTKIWKEVYGSMPDSSEKRALLEDQRKWVKVGRAATAEKYMNDGQALDVAYTQATLDRVAYLKHYASDETQEQASLHSFKQNPRVQQTPVSQQSSAKNQGDRVGPIVKGFQVGMSVNDLERNIKSLKFIMHVSGPERIKAKTKDGWVIAVFDTENTMLQRGNAKVTGIKLTRELFHDNEIPLDAFIKKCESEFQCKFTETNNSKQYGRIYNAIIYGSPNTREGFQINIEGSTKTNPPVFTLMSIFKIAKIVEHKQERASESEVNKIKF